MKKSELNHLRRLLAWLECEVGQNPAEMVEAIKSIADKLGHPDIDIEARRRLVEAHDKARRVPKYVRAALLALKKVAQVP